MIVHAIDGVDLTSPLTVELKDETRGFPTSANLGAFESTSVYIGDPAGALSLHDDMHHIWTSRETTAPSGNQVFFTGFVSPEVGWSRVGGGLVMPHGAGRVWRLDLVECNTYLLRRKLRREATTTNRPSETVSARVAWVLTTPGMSGVVVDAGLVAASSVVLDPFDYHNSDAATVLRDCANACAFNFTIRYREATVDFQLLFFDPLTSALDASALVISNVDAEVDGSTTFAPAGDADGRFNGDRIASGIVVQKKDGSDVYVTEPATAAAYAEIDLLAPTPTISQQSTATTFGNSLLARHATPEEKVVDEIEVPAESVTIVKAGQLVLAKYTHGPGWASGRYARVTRCIPKRPPNLTQARIRIGLELQPAAPSEFTYTDARLMRPTQNAGAELGYIGGGVYYPVHWSNDGDNPQSGDGSYPLVGLMSYLDSGTPGYRSGLQALGDGSGALVAAFSMSVVTTGPHTFTARIMKNGSALQSWTVTENHGGPALYSWEAVGATALVTATDVVFGDYFELQLESSTLAAAWALPTGTGNGDHQLRFYGLLLAP